MTGEEMIRIGKELRKAERILERVVGKAEVAHERRIASACARIERSESVLREQVRRKVDEYCEAYRDLTGQEASVPERMALLAEGGSADATSALPTEEKAEEDASSDEEEPEAFGVPKLPREEDKMRRLLGEVGVRAAESDKLCRLLKEA